MRSVGYCLGCALALAVLMFPPLAAAQQGGQTGGSTGSSGSSQTAPKQTTTKAPTVSEPDSGGRFGVLITGAVMLEDGTAPPFHTSIVRDCGGGAVSTDAYVDPSGRFIFQLGSSLANSVIPGADESPIVPELRSGPPGYPALGSIGSYMGASNNISPCELRAKADGYQSTVVRLNFISWGEIDVGTIILRPISRVGDVNGNVAGLQTQKAVKKAMEEGQKALAKGDYAKAEKNLKAAVEAFPMYAEAWINLGQLYEKQQRIREAWDAYSLAVEADGDLLAAHLQLAQLAMLVQQWQAMARITDRTVANDSFESPEAFLYHAIAHYNLSDLETAEISASRVVQLDIRHQIPDIHLLLARILARRNDTEGWQEELYKYLRYASSPKDMEAVRAHLRELQEAAFGSAGPAGNP